MRLLPPMLILASCTLDTAPLGSGDASVASVDWTDLGGPAGGKVGLGTANPQAVLHVRGTFSQPLTGSVSALAGSTDVAGAGTLLTHELRPYDPIRIGSEVVIIASIADDEQLTLLAPLATGASGLPAYKDAALFELDTGASYPRVSIDSHGEISLSARHADVSESSKGSLNFGPQDQAAFAADARTRLISASDRAFIDYRTENGGWGTWILGSQFRSVKDSLVVHGATGNVGIGTLNPTQRLHVVGNIVATGSITPGSSRILKRDIRQLALGDARAAVMALAPMRYRYKADPDDEHLGFIAEDVPDIFATEGRRGVDPTDITAALTRVVQAQEREITELRAEVTALKAAIRRHQ